MPFLTVLPSTCQVDRSWSDAAAYLLRISEDLPEARARVIAALLGVPLDSILIAGYRVAPSLKTIRHVANRFGLSGFCDELKPHSVLIPTRNSRGRITSLHDERLRWFGVPSVHFANARRFQDGAHLCSSTVEADALAITENVMGVASNGLSMAVVETALAPFGGIRLLHSDTWSAAA